MGPDGAASDADMSIRVDETGIVRLTWAPGLLVDEAIALRALRAVNEINGERKRPLCVDVTGTAGVTRDARKLFAGPSSVSRVALLGRSAVDRVMANFVLMVITPPVPTRFFTAEDAALAWLREDGA